MNCANHSDQPVSAYCQNCGKPLCTQCVRSVAGVVYCEPCLAARLQAGGSAGNAAGGSGWSRVPETSPSASAAAGVRLTPVSGPAPSPVLAGFLGAIPGVGAMYNGQFVKAFAHVIIFVVLISISDHFNAAGVLVGAWIFYQIFDAVQTAIARREGRPLPDPLGLNDLGQRLGVSAAAPYSAPAAAYGVPVQPITNDPAAAPGFGAVPPAAAPNPPFTAGEYNPGAGFNPGPPIPPAPPIPPGAFYGGRPEPVGAIVLIGVGMLFLLSTLGVFRWDWVGRGWPVLIILIGAGLLFSRLRSTRRAGGGL